MYVYSHRLIDALAFQPGPTVLLGFNIEILQMFRTCDCSCPASVLRLLLIVAAPYLLYGKSWEFVLLELDSSSQLLESDSHKFTHFYVSVSTIP